jgi:hypothetical protein
MIEKLVAIKFNYVLILLAFILSAITSNGAENVGRVFGYSIWVWGIAYFLSKNKTSIERYKFFLVSALVTLGISLFFFYQDYSIKSNLSEIKSLVQENQKELRATLLDEPYKSDKTLNEKIDLSVFKKAKSYEDFTSQSVKLVKMYYAFMDIQKIKLDKSINENLVFDIDSFSTIEKINVRRKKAENFILFMDQYNKEVGDFRQRYKETFYLIASDYPKEISSFDIAFKKVDSLFGEYVAVEKSVGTFLVELCNFLQPLFLKNSVIFDSKHQQFIFNQDVDANKYNSYMKKLGDLIKKEEEVLKAFYDSSSATLKKFSN